ncbi:MAG: esterase family protein [Ferruginibacter sp.]|nr:esterase family protein [Cytophagales bacterium]
MHAAPSRIQQLERIANLSGSASGHAQLDRHWADLVAKGQVPLVEGDSVVFLYRGPADSVSWQGDFNGWGRDKRFNPRGRRLGATDIWYLKATFPPDARLDYKIVLNGRDWILDPANPRQQWGGGGPNSALFMGKPRPEREISPRRSGRVGQLSEVCSLRSDSLGYDVHYRVYLPAGDASLRNLPVIYVTDGHEYANEKMGAMVTILDNLIAERKIQPVIAVFLDPRDPTNPAHNRRMTELVLHQPYVGFVTRELIPRIDGTYPTNPAADARAILGTSLGGLNAAYFGAEASDYFRLIGIHSPAFWYRPAIYQRYERSPRLPLKIYMSTGVINDTEDGARRMKAILTAKGYSLRYQEVNEGHSWGNWRGLVDEVLVYFFRK